MAEHKDPHVPDLRSYAYHERAAEILLNDPRRLDDVYRILNHWAGLYGTQAQEWAAVWLSKIEGLSAQEVSELIVEQGELADYLRKSSPFPALLSEQERLEILERYRYDCQEGSS